MMKSPTSAMKSPKAYATQALIILSLSLSSNLLYASAASVTYEGSEGVNLNFFDDCNGCHTSDGVYTWANWDEYGDASDTTNQTNISTRIALNPGDPGFMPDGGGSQVSSTLFDSWKVNDYQYRTPYVATGSSNNSVRNGTNSYSRDLSFTVNENGANTTFTVYYKKSTSGSWSTTSATGPAGSGGNGSSSNATVNKTLTALECSTTYDYYLRGTNTPGSTSGSQNTFSTPSCNTGATLSGSPSGATEDSAYTWTPTVSAGSGTDTLTFSLDSTTDADIAIDSGSGEISWTPLEGETSATIDISVSDSAADTSISDAHNNLTITVTPIIDETPVVTAISTQAVNEDIEFTYTATYTDADTHVGDVRSFSIASIPATTISIGSSTGDISWTPVNGEDGAYSVTVTVTDSKTPTGLSDTENFTLNVAAINDAPTIDSTPLANRSATEDIAFSYTPTATEIDSGDNLTWSITSTPLSPDMAIDSGSGEITWMPPEGVDRTESVTVRVTDDGSGTLYDEESFDIDVTAVDDAPVITTASISGAVEDIPYASTIAFTDSDPVDSHTFSITNTDPVNGSIAIDAGGEITWTPLNGDPDQDITIRVTDSTTPTALYDEQTYTINVLSTNDYPVIDSQPIVAPDATEDTAYSLTLSATDPDSGDTQTWSITSTPLAPDMAIDPDSGELTWTPPEGLDRTESVTIQVLDQGSFTDEVTFDIDVIAVNDTPVITTASLPGATEDVAYSTTIAYTDPDASDPRTFSLSSSPTNANITIHPTSGEITWTPVNGDGDHDVTVTVTDSGAPALDDVAVFTIAVTAVNDAPVILNTPLADQEATEDEAFSYTPVDSDIDSGDIRTWSITSTSIADDPSDIYDINIDANTGEITWTPPEGIVGPETVTIRTTDNGTNPSPLYDEETFNINITVVNDSPVMSAISNDSVEENRLFSYSVSVSDSDALDNTPDLDSNMTYSIVSIAPTPSSSNLAIDASGLITWTPGNNDARTVDPAALFQNYVVTVSVIDGGEDSSEASDQIFTLRVNLQDADTDTVPDYEDNCINTENTDQANNDADSEGDNCDDDDDNDGIPDGVETDLGLDPFDSADAALDLDNDGISNIDEYQNCQVPEVLNTYLDEASCLQTMGEDSVAPVISKEEDITLDASGYFTEVTVSASALDGIDGTIDLVTTIVVGAIDAVVNNDLGINGIFDNDDGAEDAQNDESDDIALSADIAHTYIVDFNAGRHQINFDAEDSSGNRSNASQFININPIVNLGGSQAIQEGDSSTINIYFNGDIPHEPGTFEGYPISFDYVLSGSASSSDYKITPPANVSLSSTTITIEEGGIVDQVLSLNLDTLNDAAEGEENLTITLNSVLGNAVLGDSLDHQILISDNTLAPTISLSITQNSIESVWFFDDQGMVTIQANVSGSTTPSFDWTSSDSTLGGSASGSGFSFDPSSLTDSAPHTYLVQVNASIGSASVSKQINIVYAGSQSNISASADTDGDGVNDATEGVGDSDSDGIPDYLDGYDNPLNILFTENSSVNEDSSAPAYIETEPGLTIHLGELSIVNASLGAEISTSFILDASGTPIIDDGYVHLGGFFEFIIEGLSEAKRSAAVTIPLAESIPPEAIYRKFNGSVWSTFVEDTDNSLSSANSDNGICPAPNSETYELGLLPFRNCLQLIISDGGPNDADGLINGTIVDPGGIAVPVEAEIFEPIEIKTEDPSVFTSEGPSSSGSLPLWILSLLTFGLILYRKQRIARKTTY